MLERGIFTTFVILSSFPRSCQVCHSRGLDTTDVDPEALVQWLADWVELSDAAGGKICCFEKWHCFHGKRSATLAQLRVPSSLFIHVRYCSHLLHLSATWWHVFSCLQLITCFLSALAGSQSNDWGLYLSFSKILCRPFNNPIYSSLFTIPYSTRSDSMCPTLQWY